MKNIKQLGQGMTEYLIIVALVAVACIAIYGFFGDTVRAQMGLITNELAGNDSGGARDRVENIANEASDEANESYNLSNYETNTGGGN